MKDNEKVVLEALQSLLNQRAKLGLSSHEEIDTSNSAQDRWESISEAFKLKIVDSPFFDSISSAFRQTHDYKYVCNPTFKVAFESELKSRGIPHTEIAKAIDAVDSIVETLKKEPCESGAGWNPALAEIVDLTTHADDRKPKKSDPPHGGGPIPESTDHGLMMDAFQLLKSSREPWRVVHGKLSNLADAAKQTGMHTLAESVEKYIDKRNKSIVESIIKPGK
jgi:hypothetical protein